MNVSKKSIPLIDSDKVLNFLVAGGLVIITIATIIAGAQEVWHMIDNRRVTLADLLLLFIYLEVISMVHVYLRSGSLPVRMPLYISIVALARHLILDMKTMSETEILATAAAAILIAGAILMLRYGHVRLPYEDGCEEKIKDSASSRTKKTGDH